jgi:hypothetical protein
MDLAELRERLEKASAGDREIEARLCAAVYDIPEPPQAFKLGVVPPINPIEAWRVECWSDTGHVRSHTPPRYTESLDAIVSLIERKLPGCWWEIEREFVYDNGSIKERFVGRIRRKRDSYLHVCVGALAALALCLAFVKAMEAQSNEPASDNGERG